MGLAFLGLSILVCLFPGGVIDLFAPGFGGEKSAGYSVHTYCLSCGDLFVADGADEYRAEWGEEICLACAGGPGVQDRSL